MMRRQTTLLKPNGVARQVRTVDADGIPLGRLAAEIAIILMGKHRPDYTPHVDCADKVIVTNGKKVEMTGRKGEQRLKMRYTEYPGGLKTSTYNQVREAKPELLISDAVRRMLPKNRLARVMLSHLEVYPGAAPETAPKNGIPIKVPASK
jgi:large subunit ribosomal protein L13